MKKLPHPLLLGGSILILLFSSSTGYAKAPDTTILDSSCGEWIDESADFNATLAVSVEPSIQQPTGSDCKGVFTLSTQAGYTIQLPYYPIKSRYSLFLQSFPNNSVIEFPYGIPIIAPGLDIDVKTMPIDIKKNAVVTLQGEINWKSATADAALWFMRSVLEFVPLPNGCFSPPPDEALLLALRLAPIFEDSVRSGLQGDLIGSKREFSRALFAYLDKAGEMGEGMAHDCLWEAAEEFFKKPLALTKITLGYISWLGTTSFEIIKHHGPSEGTTVVLSYIPPPPLEPTIVPDTVDKNDLASVMQWMTYLMENNEPNRIIPLVGSNGTKFAPYGMGVFPTGYNNSEEISGILEETLNYSKPICLGYDPNFGASPDKAIIYFRGLIMEMPELETTREGDVIGFQFFELENGWELFFITPIPEGALPDPQSLTPCPGETGHTAPLEIN